MRAEVAMVGYEDLCLSKGSVGQLKADHFTQSAQVHRHSCIKWPPNYNPDTSMFQADPTFPWHNLKNT